MKKQIIYILLVIPLWVISQDVVKGSVLEGDMPAEAVSVYWQNTTVGTVTNEKGEFTIPYEPNYKNLVINFVGFKETIIEVTDPNKIITHVLQEDNSLDEVVIVKEKDATQLSYRKVENTTVLGSKELLKAACCNLSESFETNPSIDVNFSDAVTGTKQIRLLGLNNPYILISQENIPNIRGASQAYGLTFIPGTWLESIQITKGAGSVVNGYESIAGQINTELQKPLSSDKFFLNAYGAGLGRLELNTHANFKVSDKWTTGLYVHGNHRGTKNDNNDDNFLDTPLMTQINLMNRWQYTDIEKGWVSFLDVRYMNDEKQAGEVDFDPEMHRFGTEKWGSEIDTERFNVSAKLGYVFKDIPYQSFGIQAAYSNHQQDSYYGLNRYDIQHQSVYASGLFNSIISNTKNKFKTGLTFTLDKYDELVNTTTYLRNENSIGTFFEYTYDNLDNFSLVAGIRGDIHNTLGAFLTPRIHARYNPWEKGVLRASVGRGKRSASIFAENQQYFASSRDFQIFNNGGKIYGLNPEIAWNYGVSFLQGFKLFDRNGDVSIDFYSTRFDNQIVVDVDNNTQQVAFYDLVGESFSNSFQFDVNYELAKHLDLRMSYKNYNSKTDYIKGRLTKALLPEHRVFANVEYKTHFLNEKQGRWKFDATWNWVGTQRIPFTGDNPAQYQLSDYSNPYNLVNLQATRVFSKKFEVYVGGENVFSYKQDNPVLSADDPFGSAFDSTLIYAPINGANYYVGLRYTL
jgi:outer membrane receptor for ferrienterochelin and colicin